MSTPNISQEPDNATSSQALIIRPFPAASEPLGNVTSSQAVANLPAPSASPTLDVAVQHHHSNTAFRQTETAIVLGRNGPIPTIMTQRQGLVKIHDILGEVIESLDRVSDAITNVRLKLEAMVETLNDINSRRETEIPSSNRERPMSVTRP